MEDSNSSQPSKCPCGFWGSANTLGLCSRCYKEHLQSKETMQTSASGKPGLSSKDAPSTSALRVPPKAVPSTASTSSTENFLKSSSLVCDSSSTDSGATGVSRLSPNAPITSDNTDSNTDNAACDSSGRGSGSKSTNEKTADSAEVTTTVIGSDNNVQDNISRCSSTDSLSSTDADKRGTKRSIGEVEDTGGKSPQKNRKRCNQCNVKLELAQRTIGQCRCGCIFCPLHRLPELHNCDFDHKEDGRKEAREKMLKPTRHVGNSCKRIDS